MADIYKIGIEILLTGSYANQLRSLAQAFGIVNARVKEIEDNIGRWGLAIAGVGAIIAGDKLLGGLTKVVKAGEDVVHQIELMKTAGDAFSSSLESANTMAEHVSQTIQTSIKSENLKSIRELTMAFGDEAQAEKYLEIVRKSQAILESVTGGKAAGEQVWALVKSGEMKGYTQNTAEFEDFINRMTMVMEASGGKVTAQDVFQTFKYGRSAMYGWDKDFQTKYLPTLIQEMKSSGGGGGGGTGGPGNALMSAYRAVVSDRMTKTARGEFRSLGLYDEDTGVKGAELFQKNPYEWVQTVLVPALKAGGYTTQDQVQAEIGRLFELRTSGQIMDLMALQGRAFAGDASRMEKDARLALGAPGLSAYDELSKHDPTMVMMEFTAQWTNLMQALGAPVVPQVTNVIKGFVDAITSMSAAVQAHPEAAKAAMEILGGTAVALVAAGIAAIAAAILPFIGTGAAITAGAAAIVGLSAAVTTLISANWDGLTAKIRGVWGAITGAFTGAPGIFGPATPDVQIGPNIQIPAQPAPAVPTAPLNIAPGLDFGDYGGPSPPVKKMNWSAPPPPAGGASSAQIGNVYLDSRPIGEIVAQVIAQGAGGPTTGSSYYDGTQGAPHPDTSHFFS